MKFIFISYLVAYSIFNVFGQNAMRTISLLNSFQDSIIVQLNEEPLIFKDGNYILLQLKNNGKIIVIDRTNKNIIEKSHKLFHKNILGLGYQAPNFLHIPISGCGKYETIIYSLNVQDTSYQLIRIKNLYGHSVQFYSLKNQFLALFNFSNEYFFIYDVITKKLIQNKTKLLPVFDTNVTCQYLFPYAFLSFINDSIISFHFVGQSTIYFMNKHYNYKLVSCISNPNPAFKDAVLAFHYLPNPKKLNIFDIMHFIGNYNYFSTLNSFIQNNKKYYYQYVFIQSYDKDKHGISIENILLTIWNDNFQVLQNLKLNPKDYILIDNQGIVLKPYYNEANQKYVIYDCGNILDLVKNQSNTE
jgi:hypothetical protein